MWINNITFFIKKDDGWKFYIKIINSAVPRKTFCIQSFQRIFFQGLPKLVAYLLQSARKKMTAKQTCGKPQQCVISRVFPTVGAFYPIVSRYQYSGTTVCQKDLNITPSAAQFTPIFHLVRVEAQHGLTEGLQTGLDELLPARPLGEVSQGHHWPARCGLGRAGFVEPVRTAWRRNSRPGATSWSHSP